MKKIYNNIILIIIIICFGTTSIADDHLSNKEIIKNLKQKITSFDVKPNKRKNILQRDKDYIKILKDQLNELKAEKEKKDKIKTATAELEREIIALGGRPLTEGQDPVETNDVVIALRKQLEEIKNLKAKQKADEEKAKTAALEKKQIKAAKKELIKEIQSLGEKPITETNPVDENEEIIALKKQLEEIKLAKEKLKADEKKQERIDKAKNELIKEIESLGEKPITSTQDIDQDEEIIALKKQLEEIRAYRV